MFFTHTLTHSRTPLSPGSHLAGCTPKGAPRRHESRSDAMSGLEGLLAGRTLGSRYRVEEVIGRGGFAAVYRARDERLGRTAAVKVITVAAQDAATRDQIRKRFAREARVAASLDHPNVVTVYDVGTDPDLQLDFLVMELLEGEDLAHRLGRPDPLPLQAAVRILRDAARGIAAGHRGGLIHRDVKPANIFLAEHDREHRFRVCVLDFGIAQIRDAEHSLTRLTRGATPLSPRYASPEQLQESQKLTPAADVYSLGVIGCELLTWERVFSPEQIRSMTRGEPFGIAVSPLLDEPVADLVDHAEADGLLGLGPAGDGGGPGAGAHLAQVEAEHALLLLAAVGHHEAVGYGVDAAFDGGVGVGGPGGQEDRARRSGGGRASGRP